jgi:hypothetical protein
VSLSLSLSLSLAKGGWVLKEPTKQVSSGPGGRGGVVWSLRMARLSFVRPPRVAFIIGCVSCNEFTFKIKKVIDRECSEKNSCFPVLFPLLHQECPSVEYAWVKATRFDDLNVAGPPPARGVRPAGDSGVHAPRDTHGGTKPHCRPRGCVNALRCVRRQDR